MAKVIVWKPKANQQILDIEEYLIANFSIQVANKFIDTLYRKLHRLQLFPESGQPTRFKTIRRLRLNKYISLFYKIHGNFIVVCLVWDSRRNPEDNPYS
jgi:plasmid stabilization system protein ParE